MSLRYIQHYQKIRSENIINFYENIDEMYPLKWRKKKEIMYYLCDEEQENPFLTDESFNMFLEIGKLLVEKGMYE